MNDKISGLSEVIEKYVKDGMKIYIGGFTHCVPYAAVHEIIRKGYKDLEICKMVPELLLDQLIAAGCCKKLVFSWAGNPGLGNLQQFRDACEKGIPDKLEIEEYSHYGLLLRLQAGASGLPFMICRTNFCSDLPKFNENIKTVTCPYTGETLSTVPAYQADLAIFHAQRADRHGNVQLWGISGETKEAAFGAKHVIVTVEEIVEDSVIKNSSSSTVLPAAIVDAVILQPFGAHPAYVSGYYDRDNNFYIQWRNNAKVENHVGNYLKEWVYGVKDRDEYMEKMSDRAKELKEGVTHAM